MKIYYHDLPDYETYPPKGISNYNDSKVFEGDFTKDGKTIHIKFLLEIGYSRWVCSQTLSGPAEDECSLTSFTVVLIRGDGDNGRITESELTKMISHVEENLEFI